MVFSFKHETEQIHSPHTLSHPSTLHSASSSRLGLHSAMVLINPLQYKNQNFLPILGEFQFKFSSTRFSRLFTSISRCASFADWFHDVSWKRSNCSLIPPRFVVQTPKKKYLTYSNSHWWVYGFLSLKQWWRAICLALFSVVPSREHSLSIFCCFVSPLRQMSPLKCKLPVGNQWKIFLVTKNCHLTCLSSRSTYVNMAEAAIDDQEQTVTVTETEGSQVKVNSVISSAFSVVFPKWTWSRI